MCKWEHCKNVGLFWNIKKKNIFNRVIHMQNRNQIKIRKIIWMKKFIKSKKNFLKQLKCISRLFKIPVSFLLTKIKLRPDISIIRTYAYEFRKNKKNFFFKYSYLNEYLILHCTNKESQKKKKFFFSIKYSKIVRIVLSHTTTWWPIS